MVLITYCVTFEGTPKTSSYSIRKEKTERREYPQPQEEAQPRKPPPRATQKPKPNPKNPPGEKTKTAAMREGVLFLRPSPYALKSKVMWQS